MTTDDLARLRSLAEAASNPDDWWLKQAHRVSPEQAAANAAYIAALDPQTILALLVAAEASERLRAVEGHTHRRRHYCGQHHQFEEVHEYAVALPPVTKAELRAARAALAALATPPPATVDEEAVADAATGVFIDAMQEPSR